ncbi:MAG: 4Fe-4S dicluster domain-containing protein [Promethearchaeota archaeon]
MAERQLISIDLEKCTGCGICEIICSWTKFQELNPIRSAIRVLKTENLDHIVIACKNCEDLPCVKVCVVKEALTEGEHTLEVDYDKCNFCGWCADACEYGAMSIDFYSKKLVFCDLCEGKPKCIEYCPKEAISLENVPKKVTSDDFF